MLLALLAGAAVVLFFFNPGEYGFYPFCVFHRTTGLLCPGCGSLRALHQLLHGHILEAFRLNALFVSSLPFWGWLGLRLMLVVFGKPVRPLNVTPRWLWLGLTLVIGFGVFRNFF